jgi:methionyl-tRNA synthetase
MEAMEIRKAAAELRAIWVSGNEYLQNAAPWTTFKTDPDAAAAVIRISLNLIRLYAVLSAPFIPAASHRVLTALYGDQAATPAATAWPTNIAEALQAVPAEHPFSVPDVLFAKISDEDREDWATRFSGVRT